MAYSMNDVLISARRKLLDTTVFSSLLDIDVGKDAPGGMYDDGWVFRSETANSAPARNPAGTGLSTVTINLKEPWGSPNAHNTLAFRLLRVSVVSDVTRQQTNSKLPAARDADLRCDRVATAIKTIFNDVANTDHFWPNNVYMPSSLLWEDLRITDVPGEDSLVEGILAFALEIL